MSDYFVIEGGHKLSGEIYPSGNKNAALPALAATLLTAEPVTLHNLPAIQDIATMGKLLESTGVQIDYLDAHTWRLQAANITVPGDEKAEGQELFRAIRGSILIAGPLLGRLGRVIIPAPGGDVIGRRRVDTHFLAFRALGATVDAANTFRLSGENLHGADILLDEASVTGTENAVMAAVLAEGRTIVRHAASEPHVQDLCNLLVAMGAKIEGIGTNTLIIHGVKELHGTEFTISSDYMEVGSYIAMAAAVGGELLIHNAVPEQMRMTRMIYKRLGVTFEVRGDDIFVPAKQKLVIEPDMGGAIPSIADAPWPAFPADLMSVSLVLATQCEGAILFHDKMFESRMFFVDKLIPMGARIVLCDPHRALVYGSSPLQGDEMESPDIRAGMAMLVAALTAKGTSTIHNIRQIDRGYENIENKLKPLGARIERRHNR